MEIERHLPEGLRHVDDEKAPAPARMRPTRSMSVIVPTWVGMWVMSTSWPAAPRS
jgi:hypothetical protein